MAAAVQLIKGWGFPQAYECHVPNAGSSGLLPAPVLPPHTPVFPIEVPHTNREPSGDGKEGYCQMYQGSTCSQVVGNRSIFVPASVTQEIIEQKVQRAITVIAHSSDLTKRCEAYAIPSVCYTAFPLCENEEPPSTTVFLDGKPFSPSTNTFFPDSRPPGTYPGRPRFLCREECEVLEADVCRVEYAIAKRHPLIGQSLGLPDCPSLPPIESVAARTCLRLGIPDVRDLIRHSETCYSGQGEHYRGAVSKSSSGRPCLPWSNMASSTAMGNDAILRVFQEHLLPTYSVELIGGHSYCRNPGATQAKPWCFVEESDWGGEGKKRVRMEFCDIPQCADHMWLYILAGGAGLSIIFLIWLVVFCVRRGRRDGGGSGGGQGGRGHEQGHLATSPSMKQPAPPGVKINGASALEMNALLPKAATGSGDGSGIGVRVQEYPTSSVRLLQELGEGAFG
ncbi:hypothetical protein J437_LFUL012922 [Ladona fulva]|uniref:Kringle domain-containing protein n=1 Tax=Ladona fulva TaxID=123851 RepID=A0A8K0KDC4_LADFU|nr:hypothetical protein J437_LFUL012922 [Ladona fulva]